MRTEGHGQAFRNVQPHQRRIPLSSRTWIYDNRLAASVASKLPKLPSNGLTGLLYVYQGTAMINSVTPLQKQEGLIFQDKSIRINIVTGAELVLSLTDEDASIYKGGMYSGNQLS